MSDAQLETIRAEGVRMVSTLFDGTLVVRDPDGVLLELVASGDLLPHIDTRPGRAEG